MPYFCTMVSRLLFVLLFTISGMVSAQTETISDSLKINRTDSLIAYARTHLGKSYGNRPGSTATFDCSGFVCHVHQAFNVVLPHGSGAQAQICEKIDWKDLRPGDLMFFSGRKPSRTQVGHVALVTYVDEEGTHMIHSTVQAGVIEEVYEKSEYFTKRFIMAGRLKTK
jgi:cell wall-associated NlpC family hydrolase